MGAASSVSAKRGSRRALATRHSSILFRKSWLGMRSVCGNAEPVFGLVVLPSLNHCSMLSRS